MKLVGKKFPLKELKKGVMCLALFPGDGLYYRAVILGAADFKVQASLITSYVHLIHTFTINVPLFLLAALLKHTFGYRLLIYLKIPILSKNRNS